MTGVGLGIAARTADRRVRVLAPVAGLLLAMMLHGTWNLIPTLAQATGEAVISLRRTSRSMVPIFFGMVGLALWLRSGEGRLTERILPDYVRAGWFEPARGGRPGHAWAGGSRPDLGQRVGRGRRAARDAWLPVRRDPACVCCATGCGVGWTAAAERERTRGWSGSRWTRSRRTVFFVCRDRRRRGRLGR